MPAAARHAVLLIALALTAPAAASAASTPVDVGAGSQARIAVDAAGIAHLTRTETVAGQDTTHYCQLALLAKACGRPHDFSYPVGPEQGGSSGTWPLLPGDGRLFVLDSRCCTNYATKFVYPSTDGGASFGPAAEVGDDNNSGASVSGAALFAPAGALGRPGESVLTFSDQATLGLSFQATGTAGPRVVAGRVNVLTQGDATSGSLALSGNTLVAAWTSIDDNNVYWRQWSGAGDVNDAASWGPITVLDAANINSGSRLASGPGGIYVAYDRGAPGSEQVVLRRFGGGSWGAPVPLTDGADSPRFFDLVQDASGALHFAWQDSAGRLRYRFATDAGNGTFTAARTLLEQNPLGGYFNIRLGVGSGNTKWVTWEDSSPVHVRALTIAPGLLPPPVEGKVVNAVPVKGTVRVKLPAGAATRAKDSWTRAAASGFVPLESIGRQLPVGSTLDTTKGTVQLSAATGAAGTQSGRFNAGLFSVTQGRKNPLTTLSMTGAGLNACSRLPKGGSAKLVAARKHRRTLFSNVHGHFRTRGRNSVATVRGTKYRMTDTCAGTLTQVTAGTVVVRDFRLRKTTKVRAGHRYFAQARRR